MEDFVVKQYIDERVTIKGNGFDGLEIGDTREDAQEFIDFVNKEIKELEEKLKESERKNRRLSEAMEMYKVASQYLLRANETYEKLITKNKKEQ